MAPDDLDLKTTRAFRGYVRKDLTRKFKARWPDLPSYVLEYYLAKYCSAQDEIAVQMGEGVVQDTLIARFVKPTERAGTLERLRRGARIEVIDRIAIWPEGAGFRCRLELLQEKDVRIALKLVERLQHAPGFFDVGVWTELRLGIDEGSGQLHVEDARTFEISQFDLEELKRCRTTFTSDEWLDLLVRTLGYESADLSRRAKLLLACRLLPLVEPNLNLIELSPPGRGKSHTARETSPFVFRIESQRITAARLFGHAASKAPGVMGRFDVVALDPGSVVDRLPAEVVSLLSHYLVTQEYERGKNAGRAQAGVCFLLDDASGKDDLRAALPRFLRDDAAALAAVDLLLPGWELPRLGADQTTTHVGLPLEYLGKAMRVLRFQERGDPLLDVECGSAVDSTDRRSIRRVLCGLEKLLFPHQKPSATERDELLLLAAEGRRNVKELLKRGGSMAHFATAFTFADRGTGNAILSAPALPNSGPEVEQPTAQAVPGVLLAAGRTPEGLVALHRVEVATAPGHGELEILGRLDPAAEESIRIGFGFLQENAQGLGVADELAQARVRIQCVDALGNGASTGVGVGAFLAMCSALRALPVPARTAVVGDLTLKGGLVDTPIPDGLAQFLHSSSAREVWLPDPQSKGKVQEVAPGVRMYRSPKHAAKEMFGDALKAVPPATEWQGSLPFPLASILDLHESAADADLQLRALLAFFEALAMFHSIVLLSGLRHHPEHDAVIGAMKDGVSFELGSFGLWRHVFAHVSKWTRGRRQAAQGEALALFRTSRVEVLDQLCSPELNQVFTDTNTLRNDWKGHGAAVVSEAQALDRVAKLQPFLGRVRRATPTVWESYELVRQRSMDLVDEQWHCTVDRLRGPNPTFKPLTVTTQGPMDKKKLYLLDDTIRSPLPLVPLLRVSPQSVAYFYDRRHGAPVRWLSQHAMEENELQENVPETMEWLDRVQALAKTDNPPEPHGRSA